VASFIPRHTTVFRPMTPVALDWADDELQYSERKADAHRHGCADRWTMTPPAIQRLSNELLRAILDQIEPDPDKTVPIDRRQFLSVESFVRPPDTSRGSVKDIGAFRCTCHRFAEIGAPLLYTRVAGRFSRSGLKKLEQLAEWPHLARHVKKFSYLVPYFYRNGA